MWDNFAQMTFDAILPAGGRVPDDFAAEAGTSVKALIELGGQSVLERTLVALAQTGRVRRSVVIGGEEVHAHPASRLAGEILPEGASGPDNIYRGLESLLAQPEPPDKVLIVTTDLPFLSAELINDFLAKAPLEKDICLPLIRQSAFLERFPGAGATFVKLRDENWTAGCVYTLDTQALMRCRPHIERVFENRKSKLGMAKLLGPAFVLKFVCNRLTLGDVQRKIQQITRCDGVPVPESPPELAYDIDSLDEYRYAQKIFG